MIGIWAIAKRIPRGFALLFNFITIFLTVFLLLGCYNSSNESTFLVRYQLNKDSAFYPTVQSSFRQSTNTAGLEKVKIRSGYMGVCIDNIPTTYNLQNDSQTSICYPRKNLTQTSLYKDLQIQLFDPSASNSTVSLNILELAQITSVNVIHPYILMATIVLTIIMFLCIFYSIIPGLPFKVYLSRFLLLLSPALALLWGMGSIWTHIGIHASHKLVPVASMHIVNVYKGKKAATMTWFSFTFLIIVCLIIWFLHFRDLKNTDEEIIDTTNIKNHQNYYYSDTSSYGTKV